MFSFSLREIISNIVGSLVADAITPTGMIGWGITILFVVGWIIHWNRQQRAAKNPGMASWQFIALCFAVALVAVGMGAYGLGLNFSSKQSAIAHELPPKSDAQTPPPTPPKPPAPIYTERNVRELLDALTDAHDLIQKTLLPMSIQIETNVANWRTGISNYGVDGYSKNLRAIFNGLQTQFWPALNNFIYEKKSLYKDEMRTAFLLDDEVAKGELARSLQRSIDALQLLPDSPTEKTKELVAPQLDELKTQSNLLYNWLLTSRTRIESMMANLRKNGELGFEKIK